MGHDYLDDASDHLRNAAVATTDDDHEQRLSDHSERLAKLAATESGPDHGRLARITHALDELSADVGADAGEHVAAAKEDVAAHRETVDGV
jgi:hypothetical protein